MKYNLYRSILWLIVFLAATIRIYTQDVKTLSGHTGNINCITFSPDAKKLLSGSSDGSVKVWNSETGDLLNTVTFGDNITSVSYSGTGNVYGVTSIGSAFLTDMETGYITARFEKRPNTYNISFSPDGNYIAVNSFYKTDHYYYKDGQKYEFQKYHFLVDIYDGSSYRLLKTLKVLEEDRKALLKLFGDNVMESYRTNYFMSTFTRDSKFLATGLPNGHINIYSFITNDFRRDFTGHDKNVYGLEFSSDGNYLISASMDEEVKVWNITTGKSIKTMNGHDNDVNDAVFSPDSKFAASASDDETVKVWDVSKGKHIKTLKGHQGDVITVIFSPDGRYIASGGKDEKIKLWNTESFLPELKLYTAEFDAKIGINASIQEEKNAEINAVNIEYFMPKGEFETTEEYNSRLEIGRMKKQEIEDRYREKLEAQQFVKQQEVEELKTKEQEEKERKIAESERDTVLKIDNLSKYDADNETFTVTVKNVTGKIKVPRSEAPGLKDGWKKAQVKCRKKLSDNLKYHNYSSLVVVHPVSKSEYPVDDGKKKEEESVNNNNNSEVTPNEVGSGNITIETAYLKDVNDKKRNLTFGGTFPRVTIPNNKSLESEVNTAIENNIAKFLSVWQEEVDINISFEVVTLDDKYLSIVQKAGGMFAGTGTSCGIVGNAYTVNADLKNGKVMTNFDLGVENIGTKEFNNAVLKYFRTESDYATPDPDIESIPQIRSGTSFADYNYAIKNGYLVIAEFAMPMACVSKGVYIIPIRKFNN